MNFSTHNDDFDINANGTFLQGYIRTDYGLLVSLFGGSHEGDAYKTDWEWTIKFDDGTVATVYNWKNGPNYGYSTVTGDDIVEWHVGGHSQQAMENVKRALTANPG